VSRTLVAADSGDPVDSVGTRAGPGRARRRRPPVAVGAPGVRAPGVRALAVLVIVAGLTLRFALLGRQSYWIDELFSVHETSGSLATLRRLGSTEVHPPLYALLLWGWTKLGDSHEVWTRLFSAGCSAASVLVTARGLRSVRLGAHLRWALIAATAASSTSIVYAVDTRSYALLGLASVGLTAATLRAAVFTLDGDDVPATTYLGWLGWSLLAATTHLFGTVLSLGALAVLVITTLLRRPAAPGRRLLTWTALAAIGSSLQLGWLLHGRGVPGFATGTEWIEAPTGRDVWDLVTTTFGSGGLTMHKDGFAWTSAVGAITVAALCLAAVLLRLLPTRLSPRRAERPAGSALGPAQSQAETLGRAPAQAAAILLGLSLVVVLAAYGVSQWRHLWTLRNMVIVAPALSWGVICLAVAIPRTAAGRRGIAAAAVALLGVGLVPVAVGLAHPYKTDFRGLYDELVAVHRDRPDASFVFLGVTPTGWESASDLPADDPVWAAIYRQARIYPSTAPRAIRTPGPELVVFYRSVVDPNLDQEVAAVIARLGGGSCRRVPLQGLGVVRCD
jgi:hypothetical protein